MSRRARQRRKLLRSTIRSSRETPRALEVGERRAHAYPRIDALLTASAGAAWQAWLDGTLRAIVAPAAIASLGASLALGAGCGTPAQASTLGAPVAVLAPMAPSSPRTGTGKPTGLATLLPLPPPPPLPENVPAPLVPPPPAHHPRPHVQHHMLGGAIAAPQVQPVTLGGAPPPAAIY